MTHIQVHNASNDAFTILTNTRLGVLTAYDADGCYLVNSNAQTLVLNCFYAKSRELNFLISEWFRIYSTKAVK